MKKLAILTINFLIVFAVAQGQTQKAGQEKAKETKKEQKAQRVALKKLPGNAVDVRAQNSFLEEFSGAKDATWKRVETFDEVSFTNKDGQKMKAFYDYNGKLVGTTVHKTFADVPEKGQNEIKKGYKDYTIGQVVFFDDNEVNDTDMRLYDTQFDDEDNYFVEMIKGTKRVILQVKPNGEVFFFKELKQ
jgi:hypothetical protein